MAYRFTVSPDFTPAHLSGWFIFNTWLQKQTGLSIHLEMYDHYQALHSALGANEVDLIYCNPFDAATLVRKQGFVPLVKAADIANETIIAVRADNSVRDVTDLSANARLAYTAAPDVRLIGLMLLEPGNLDNGNTFPVFCDSYVLVAKQLLTNNADIGIFLAEAYDDLTSITRRQLKVLVRSQICVIHHVLLIGSKLKHKRAEIQQALLDMPKTAKGLAALDSLAFSNWEKVSDEEMEFMIDLMDTLNT